MVATQLREVVTLDSMSVNTLDKFREELMDEMNKRDVNQRAFMQQLNQTKIILDTVIEGQEELEELAGELKDTVD